MPIGQGYQFVLVRSDDSDRCSTPNNTIMLRGLAQHITETDIRQDIANNGLAPRDIRLIRKKDTGTVQTDSIIFFVII